MKYITRITLIFAIWVSAAGAAEPILVDSDWLSARLNSPSLVLVDMASDPTQYQRFHIPGAVYLPYQTLVQRRKDQVVVRLDDDKLFKVLGSVGISDDAHVVVYDDIGGLQAGRLFWELERIGHNKVSLLDGGLVQWILEGRKVVASPTLPKPVVYVPSAGKRRDNEATLANVKTANEQSGAVLLDVRTREEYMGGRSRKHRSGHIPGAKWWPWEQAVDFDQGFRLRSAAVLIESLKKAGVADTDTPLIAYCRSGHRASQTYFVLRQLGYDNVKIYDGSMLEYQLDRTAPLRRGMQP